MEFYRHGGTPLKDHLAHGVLVQIQIQQGEDGRLVCLGISDSMFGESQ
jgi:hypothetical protein